MFSFALVPPVKIRSAPAAEIDTDVLAVPVFEGEERGADLQALDTATGGALTLALESRELRGRPYEIFVTPVTGTGWKSQRIAFVGAGPRAEYSTERLRRVATAVALSFVRMFGITGGYHRYFSHRTYRTGRVFQFVLAWLGASSVQKGPLWWAAHHRHHHQYSDEDPDLHSPGLQGFYWSHVGWILAPDYEATQYRRIPDMAKYPELMWLNTWHLVPGITLAVVRSDKVLAITGALHQLADRLRQHVAEGEPGFEFES